MPLTAGFFGKFYIFKAALDANLIWLAIIGLLNSAVAAYYYLRILVVMYFREPGEATSTLTPASPGNPDGAVDFGARHADPGHLPIAGAQLRAKIEHVQ